MNILANTDQQGGMPAKLNDWRWIAAGLSEAFKGVLSPFDIAAHHTVILSGCERTVLSGTVTISEGYISIGGEVCYVPEHSYAEPSGGDVEYFVVDITYDPDGQKAFKNPPIPTLIDTYEIRVGKIEVSASLPSGYTLLGSVKKYPELINEFITPTTVNTLVTEATVNDLVTDATVNSLIDPSLVNSMITDTTVNSLLDLNGINNGTGVFTIKTGMVMMWSGSIATIPTGYTLCNGASLSTTTYATLFSKLGYLHGGSGSSFNLPDLRARFIAGYSGSGDYAAIGDTGGQDSFTIGEDNLPEHSHDINDPGHTHSYTPSNSGGGILCSDGSGTVEDGNDPPPSIPAGTASGFSINSHTTGITIENSGGISSPEAIDNRPAFYTLAFIIKT